MRTRWLLVAFVTVAANVLAQDSFEVASVRRNTSGEARMSFGFEPGGRLVMVNAPVRMLLLQGWWPPGRAFSGHGFAERVSTAHRAGRAGRATRPRPAR